MKPVLAPIKKSDKKIVKHSFPKVIFGRALSRPYGQRFVMENVVLTVAGDPQLKEQITITFEGDMPFGRQSFTYRLNYNRGYSWPRTTFPAPIEWGSGMENLAHTRRVLVEGKYEFSDRIKLGVLHEYVSPSGYHEFEAAARELQSLENWWGVSDRASFIAKGHIKI